MGSVVGSNTVERTVPETLDDFKSVLLTSERRIHSEIGVALQKLLFGKAEIMRSCLGSHLDAALLRVANELDRVLGADVADVNGNTQSVREAYLAHCSAILGGIGNTLYAELARNLALVHYAAVGNRQALAVSRYRKSERRSRLHRADEHLCVLDRSSVV